MSDPFVSLLIPTARQDSDGTVAESFVIPGTPFQHRLGSGLSPAYPSGMPLVPHGAAPLAAPAAPTAGAAQTVGNLNNNGDYQWAVTLVTKFGETTPSTVLHIAGIGSGKVGQAINIPAATGTSANPVLMRRVYRTLDAGSQLYLVAEIDDSAVSSYVDTVSDNRLVTAAPGSNTSGLEGAVTISGASTTWTEQPPGATLTTGGFIVDYTITNTGGTITFYSGDAGKSVTVTYTAATMLGSTYFNAIQSALNLTHDNLTMLPIPPSYIVSGGVPTSISGASLSVTQPATQAAINQTTFATYVNVAATTLTMSPSLTQYVDLDTSGVYHITTTGSPAAGNIRLYSAVTNGTGVTQVTRLASKIPFTQAQIQMDPTEAGTNDPVLLTSLLNNLNRIRYQLGLVVGGAWNTAVQMIPLSQKAAASGVASLDSNSRVIQKPVNGIRQVAFAGPGEYDMSSAYQSTSSLARADWGSLENVPCTVAITTTGSSRLVVYLSATLNNRLIGGGNWTTLGVSVDGGAVQVLGHAVTVTANTWYDAPLAGVIVTGVLSAAAHTVEIVYQCGGPGGANPSASILGGSQPAAVGFTVVVAEFS